MASKNAQRKTKQTIALFIATFLVTLVGVVYLIKSFSPNVDVEIGGEEEYEQNEEPLSDSKGAVDDRLKWIQLEDNMPGVSKRSENSETDEITYEPSEFVSKQEDKHTKQEEILDEEITLPQNTHAEQVRTHAHSAPPVPPVPKLAQAEPFKMTKVYVGHYETIEQAIQAQNKLMNTSIGVSPFVKDIGGAYVLQAGSFASIQKAESVAEQLNLAGFSARIVQE